MTGSINRFVEKQQNLNQQFNDFPAVKCYDKENRRGESGMKSLCISIRSAETGERIKQLMEENGYTVRDIQQAMGFENPQAIYKWMPGKNLPSLDNLLILSRLLHTHMEDILVVDGDMEINGRNKRTAGTGGKGSAGGGNRVNRLLCYVQEYLGIPKSRI